MTSFVRVNHKVEKTMAKTVIMLTRNISTKENINYDQFAIRVGG